MRKALLFSCLAGLSVAFLGAQGQSQDVHPDGRGDRTRYVPPRQVSSGSVPTGNGISYHGGPVMDTVSGSPVTVYYIWYGNWPGLDPTANSVLTNFANNIGGSPYFNINTTYTDGSGNPVINAVKYGGSVNDNYSRGTALSDSDIQLIVASHAGVDLPLDTNGVYFVLTTDDVSETTGFCSRYCGWHTYGTIGGANIKYSFVGDPLACPGACEWQSTGPNGTGGGDGMASVVAHELEEATSDPNLNAWYDTSGNENADKCAWTFGTTYNSSNGALANMKLGGLDYLIQQNWVDAAGGYCALSYGSAGPDFSLSASPSSQTVTAGGSTSYTVSVNALNGFTGTVGSFSASGLPSGASASFNPLTATSSSPTTMTVLTSAGTPPGSYTVTISGTSGALNHSTTATLNIPDFSLSASPSSLTVNQSSSGQSTISVKALFGFTGTVSSFGASGLPTGATASFSPSSATSSTPTVMTVTVGSTTTPGTYTVTVSGSDNGVTHTTTVNLTVQNPNADFSISAQSTASVGHPGSVQISVTVTPLGGFSSTVGFSVSGLPPRSSSSFNPTSVAGSGSTTLTISTSRKTSTGTYSVRITGTGGGKSHTATVSLTVH